MLWFEFGRQNNYQTNGKMELYVLSIKGRQVRLRELSSHHDNECRLQNFVPNPLRRLSPLVKIFVGSYQAGFTDGLSTTDQIFTVRQILQKCREYQVLTHHLFIDFKAAYDSIDRVQLWQLLHSSIHLPQQAYNIDTGNDKWSAEQCSNIRCLIGSIRMP